MGRLRKIIVKHYGPSDSNNTTTTAAAAYFLVQFFFSKILNEIQIFGQNYPTVILNPSFQFLIYLFSFSFFYSHIYFNNSNII